VIRNIFWDLDGALFDTVPAITHAFSKSMNALGRPVALNVIDGLVRQSLDQCVLAISERFSLEPDFLRQQFEEHYRQLAPGNQLPFPGGKDVCTYIQNRGGLNIVLTQTDQASAQQLLTSHDFDALVAGIFSLEMGGACRPDGYLFETALKEFGLEKESTLVVSSRDADIQAGIELGMPTCLFRRIVSSASADYRIDSLAQLQAMLKEILP
jgi:phosphoglycolate phosphatase-like HAD superfamily hydrolase